MTSNHLITLREDFTAPLRRVNANGTAVLSPNRGSSQNMNLRKLSSSTITTDTMHEVN